MISISRGAFPARAQDFSNSSSNDRCGEPAGVLYFEITWLPFYVLRERHLSMGTIGKIGGLGYLCYAAAAVVFGWISDRWIAAGGTPPLVRKTFAGAGTAGLFLFGCARAGPTVSVILLLLAFAAGGMCGSNISAITQTLVGPRMAARWTGWQNFLGNLAGVIAPAVTGFVIDYAGRFFLAFVIMAVVALLAAVSYILVFGPVKEIAWEGSPGSDVGGDAVSSIEASPLFVLESCS